MRFVTKVVIGVLVAMAIVIAISLIVQAVIHSGTSEKGPFVGTWQSNDQSARLAIDGGPDSYSGTLVTAQAAASVSFVRHGNQLRVDSSQTDTMARAVIDYQPATGRLTLGSVGPTLRSVAAPAEFTRISTGISDSFGPSDAWVKVASAKGSLLHWKNVSFRTRGGMVRITAIMTYPPDAPDHGYSDDGLAQVKPRASATDIETVDSDFMPSTPHDVEMIDEVSAQALTPGVWRYGIGNGTATYSLTIYVRK